jgi:hypothetical protein
LAEGVDMFGLEAVATGGEKKPSENIPFMKINLVGYGS